jgi:heme-degrading monooxygenase HmoA
VPATTPEPPYYAVIFTSVRTDDDDGYAATAERMFDLAARQPGYLGVETAHGDEGITVSYWRDEAAIAAWRNEGEHRLAQGQAERWYEGFMVRVARVERAYDQGT